ncbi:SLC13 family permease [Roseobacter sp. OBYS 0001]|uniref:SLC13 family permease n=1 Tax=Roseobacter sp. OBYS 0001 TaxID=882651 RepID=UPI001BB91A59|nr:SLC13 family permease [Roseobacter sp. OBYS 0001]GIT85810.1 hypothetical protein ROBYS_08260 [Roseobacter sp. OBYS 0001]
MSDKTQPSVRHTGPPPIVEVLGWCLCLVVPFGVFFALRNAGMASNSAVFLAIISLPLVMWPFSLLPDFVPGLLAVVMILLVGAAPPEIVLSGFSSFGYLLIIAILGLGALIRTSGLVNRCAALMINRLPGNVLAYSGTLFFGGLLLTPFLPSPAGRLAVVAPLVAQLEERIGPQIGTKGRTLIFMGGLDGVTLLTAAFLTAAPVNLIVYSMLPQQERVAFQFVDWVTAASVAIAVMIAGYIVIALLTSFDATRIKKTDTKDLGSATKALSRKEFEALAEGKTPAGQGAEVVTPSEKLSQREWGAIGGIVLLGVGVLTTPMHLIPAPVLAFLILSLLFCVQIMNKSDFVSEIDWSFIFLLGALVGFTNTAAHLGLTDLLVTEISWLGDILRQDFATFILILAGVIVTARIIIPQTAVTLVLVTALLPLAEASGVSAWVVGFSILMLNDALIFDFQSPMHVAFRHATGIGKDPGRTISLTRLTIQRIAIVALRLGAILASIPFWKSLGIL